MTTDGPQTAALRVLVVCGGCSAEREVSVESGRAVEQALQEAGHVTGIWDPAERPVSSLNPADWDVVFPALHGTGGEDGVLYQRLEEFGLHWVGCSVAGSALTFDKSLTRTRLLQHGIPVPPGRTIQSTDAPRPQSYPVVIKPARQGSSIGVSLVRDDDQWMPGLADAFSFGTDVVVESYIDGREVSVPVIDNEVFPAVEIIVQDGWYDYRNKYEVETTEYRATPDDLPPGLGELAQQACAACEVDGIMRVDFRLDHSGQPYVLEINTIPGMTAHSLVPLSAAAAGLSLAELCDRCVRRRVA